MNELINKLKSLRDAHRDPAASSVIGFFPWDELIDVLEDQEMRIQGLQERMDLADEAVDPPKDYAPATASAEVTADEPGDTTPILDGK